MKRTSFTFLFGFCFCLSLLGCDAAEPITADDGQGGAGGTDVDAGNGGHDAMAGCESDNDCRGDRICVHGECQFPPQEDAAEPDDADQADAGTDDATPDEGDGEVDADESTPAHERDLCDNNRDDDKDGQIDCDDSDCTEAAVCRDPNECNPACADGFECRQGRCYQQDPCDSISCREGYECRDGDCVQVDACANVVCQNGFVCREGRCYQRVSCDNITCQSGYHCDPNTTNCVQDACVQQCGGRECGADGCGGSCGACGAGEICQNSQCIVDPNPNPEGAEDCSDGVDNDRDGLTDCNDPGCSGVARCQNNDRDGDGRSNDTDNCPDRANADQANRDGDNYGDVCDNCPATVNNQQTDSDHDGIGDVCDNGQQCGNNLPACGAGQHCENGLCTQDCGNDNACPRNQVCQQGRCVDQVNACDANRACPAGQECAAGQCIPTNCAADQSCVDDHPNLCRDTGVKLWFIGTHPTTNAANVDLRVGFTTLANLSGAGNEADFNNRVASSALNDFVLSRPDATSIYFWPYPWGSFQNLSAADRESWCNRSGLYQDRCQVLRRTSAKSDGTSCVAPHDGRAR